MQTRRPSQVGETPRRLPVGALTIFGWVWAPIGPVADCLLCVDKRPPQLRVAAVLDNGLTQGVTQVWQP